MTQLGAYVPPVYGLALASLRQRALRRPLLTRRLALGAMELAAAIIRGDLCGDRGPFLARF